MKKGIDKELLGVLFKQYNAAYFGNVLKVPRFSTYKGISALGTLFTWNGKKKRPKLEIARNVDWTEHSLRSVLVHEMIHLYLWQTEGDGDGKHGRRFKAVMRDLNRKYDLGIKTRNSEIHFNDRTSFLQKIFSLLHIGR